MNRYAVLSTIGSGATSVVKLAKDTKSGILSFVFGKHRSICSSEAVPCNNIPVIRRIKESNGRRSEDSFDL